MNNFANDQTLNLRKPRRSGVVYMTPQRIPNSFAEFVKSKRLELGLGQSNFQNQLEKISGVSFGVKYVSLVETGVRRNMPLQFLQAFSELTQTNIDEVTTLYKTRKIPIARESDDRLVLLAGNTLAETLEAILTKKYEPSFRRIMREKAAQLAEHIEKNSGIAEALTDIETWQGKLEKPVSSPPAPSHPS